MLKEVITDELMLEYNWDGRAGKMSLKSMELFSKVIFGKYLFTVCMGLLRGDVLTRLEPRSS